MKLALQTPKESLSLAYRRLRPMRSKLDLFKKQLKELLNNLADSLDKREDHAKIFVRDFLNETYYKGVNVINTKGDNDLVVHLGKTEAENVGVIIETKKPNSKAEMPTKEKPNCKALHELVLYYLHERIDKENIDLKYLIITDAYKWYIFEAAWFEKHFYRNAVFRKQYEEWRDKKKVTQDTELFYTAIAKPSIDKIEDDAPCTYFDIKNYERVLEKTGEEDKNLLALYKILSPGHLLKAGFEDDSNKLDEKFYKELLHIIGLEEVKDGSKFVIRRKEENANKGSLLENAISLLETEGYEKVSDISQYGITKEERLFNIALELCITWINRILFLKLLEGQLVSYHNGDRDYLFLNPKTIPDYSELFKLFHKVLAVDIHKRDAGLQKKYSRVPYLNSSLFEISELENVTIKINSLDHSLELEFIGTTILKEEKKKADSLPALDYLFKFLNAYDFASESTEDIDEENKTLINASVLGKVFEKINGYKDGSIFTPGFITMYMCRQSIRQAVLQRFKDKYKWNVEEFDDLKNYLKEKRNKKGILEFNELINSLHICDPAVGSGHFLVSALNELIAIKSELGILADRAGILLECDVTIINDELNVLIDKHGEVDFFEYKVFKGEVWDKTQRIQKTLFHEKQTIIENCLFGVDINPNSVKICQLRLWIELLKNAYYRDEVNYTDLETLPNIDINIKCGNSLISRFPLDADLKKALKSIKYDIAAYRGFVNEYKNAKDREFKKGLEKIINTIKSDFRIEIGRYDPKYIKLQKLQYEYNVLIAPNMFREEEVDYGNKNYKKEKEEKIKELEEEINKLSRDVEEIKNNPIYKNAIEWRFEFPEVLNNNGDFDGFDVVIGNPPYGVNINKNSNPVLAEQYKEILKGELETYILFYYKGLKILSNKGLLSYITPDSWFTNKGAATFRKYIATNYSIIDVYDVYKPFTAAKDTRVHTVLISALKSETDITVKQVHPQNTEFVYRDYSIPSRVISSFLDSEWRFYINQKERDIFYKMESKSRPLEKIFNVKYGLRTGDNEKYITEDITKYPSIAGADIADLYEIKWKPKYLRNIEELSQGYFNEHYAEKKIIVQRIRTNSLNLNARWIEAAYIEGNYIPNDSLTYIYEKLKDYSLLYLLAVLNSFLLNKYYRLYYTDVNVKPTYLAQLPIPNISHNAQKPFITLVDKILASKEQGKDTGELEAKIDAMVYELYGLTEEEIKIVEGKN